MGGLVDERTETFRDQVPFLGDIPFVGRLFRTEGSRSAKQNLTIFVTATQVDVNGMTSAERELALQ
jgi:general secretion pathway protein D